MISFCHHSKLSTCLIVYPQRYCTNHAFLDKHHCQNNNNNAPIRAAHKYTPKRSGVEAKQDISPQNLWPITLLKGGKLRFYSLSGEGLEHIFLAWKCHSGHMELCEECNNCTKFQSYIEKVLTDIKFFCDFT